MRHLGAGIALAMTACGGATEVEPGVGSGSSGGTTSAGATTLSTTEGSGGTTDDATSASSMTSMTSMTSSPTTSSGTESTTDATTSGSGSTSDGSTGPAPANCTDSELNGDETDVDCGGSCPGCDFGQMCADNNDCLNNTCDNGTMCILPAPRVWLDGRDSNTLFTNNGCNQNNPNVGDSIQCWRNKGSSGGDFIEVSSTGTFADGGGVELSDDTYVRDGVFNGALGSVMVFVVLQEVNTGSAFAFNLNHPQLGAANRYAAQVPNEDQMRRIIWDPGGDANRVESPANAFGFGTQHITVLENSGFAAQRAIYLDGAEVAQMNGSVAPAASDVSIGNGGDMIVREFRVYAASLGPRAQQEVEGDLACTWNLRDLLPATHPYFDADPANNADCP